MCGPLFSRRFNPLLLVIGLIVAPPFAASQSNDELHFIRPTPALRMANADGKPKTFCQQWHIYSIDKYITTVLLVNNDNKVGRLGDDHLHGRYLSVRPELGLLTSTARTFIQEGITTEYATQVLGTTLDNGRLYAQYLKKSSRVLFENSHEPFSLSSPLSPAVVTSWVGEGDLVHSHSRAYIQSHNDLFNADEPDWRVIDDSLGLITSGHVSVSAEFVGNTDFPKIKDSPQVLVSAAIESAVFLDSKNTTESVTHGTQAEDNSGGQLAGKFAPHTVQPVGDLPTFTVKNYFEPSGYHHSNDETSAELFNINSDGDIDTDERRSAKEYYYQQQQQSVQLKQSEQHLLSFPKKRLLSTVTYYGFADFTTIVGDSVIVFSPSSTHPTSLGGHVTSIKGMATLRTTPMQDQRFTLIGSTTVSKAALDTETDADVDTFNQPFASIRKTVEPTETVVDMEVTFQANVTSTRPSVETSSRSSLDLHMAGIEKASTQQTNIVESSVDKSTLSLPTDEEILEIYASLSKAQAVQQSNLLRLQITPSNSNGHGGATTIFVDDDPFANFVEPSKIVKANFETIPTKKDELQEEKELSSHINLLESKAESPSKTVEEIETTTRSATGISQVMIESTQLQSLSQDSVEINCDHHSSQVFLTQLPKLLTNLRTHIQEESTIIETSFLSSFDIKETTKYFCVPTSQIAETTAITEVATTATKPNLELELKPTSELETETETDNISTMKALGEMEQVEVTTEEMILEENLSKIASITESSNADEDYVTETDNENEDYDNENDSENGQNEVDVIFKTLFTTYTYLTTFFEGASTAISSHTEIVTNVITSIVGSSQQQEGSSSIVINTDSSTTAPETASSTVIAPLTQKYIIQNELDRLLHSSANDVISNLDELGHGTLQLYDSKYTKTFYTTYTYYTTIFADSASEITSRTEVFTNYVSELLSESIPTIDVAIMSTPSSAAAILTASIAATSTNSIYNNQASEELWKAEEKHESVILVTDVHSSSSTSDQTQVIGPLVSLVNRDQPIEDQVSSESNTEEIIPSETLLLQTSFTTFTFYTTMYVADVTNVVSRLETVTNIATETVKPTKIQQSQGQEDKDVAALPITYFTTFTYWTKLAKDGEITTISREETISNVIEPTNQQSLESSANLQQTATNSITGYPVMVPINASTAFSTDNAGATTTYYTTYTYYTTLYEENNTVTNSRLETITNIIRPTAEFSDSDLAITQSTTLPVISTSLMGANVSSNSSNLSNLIFYDYKHIIDADSVSTLYYSTNIYASINEDGGLVEQTSSTTSLHVDESRKMHLAATSSPIGAVASNDEDGALLRQYKTGLVRLIEGTRIGRNTTTFYQSKVIGTIIDNRYAQIIESTSSFLFETPIEPSATSNLVDTIIMSTTQSFTEVNLDEEKHNDNTNASSDDKDQVENENSIDNDNNLSSGPAQSQEKKRTFAPVIRPFASRNRPTNRFAPKQKTQSASSATIITRLDITPTITATPALKSVGRFGSLRRISVSNAPNILSTSSRRLFGRPIKPSSGEPVSQISSSNVQVSNSISTLPRNRFGSSLRTALTSSPSKRLSSSYRGSSSSNNYRISALNRIKSTLVINPSTSIVKSSADPTTLVLLEEDETSIEETNAENSEDDAKASDNARRQQNPLLRFRRPLNRPNGFTLANRSSATFTAITSPTRKSSLAGRTKSTKAAASATTTSTTTRPRPRTFQRPTISNLQTSPRSQNKLFPSRGLQQKKEQKQDETELNENDDAEYEDGDEDTDADEDDLGSDNGNNRRRRSQSNIKNLTRTRRETSDALNRSRFRFRRPKTASTEEPELGLGNDEGTDGTNTSINTRLKQHVRYGSRFQSHSQQSAATSSTQSSPSSSTQRGAIRPTRPITPRMQFTLREKDTSVIKSNSRQGRVGNQSSTTSLRRHQQSPGTMSLRRLTTNGSLHSRRLKSFAKHNTVDIPNQRTTGATRSRNTNRGRSSASRGRMPHRNEDSSSTDLGSITITVTHLVPAEVTIPVVNGQVTEYKSLVTGKTSLEVLAPHQYTQMLGNNGQTSLFLTREDSSINPAGVMELTRYLLHDTMTTTVTFTPTTIRGRKTSFSHILPSTVYSVENVVTTLQPQISANAPLANILLSQLLLGNINLPANQLLGVLGQPVQGSLAATGLPLEPAPGVLLQPQTEYRTHTSTYVTTIYDGKSTILPLTFQGKKILTTVFDTTAQTITATEYSVDTIINTATIQQQQHLQQQPQPQVNSLLLQQLLLQQQQQQLQIPQQISNTVMPQIFSGDNLQELDGSDALGDAVAHMRDNIDDIIVTEIDADRKNIRKKLRKSGKSQKRQKPKSADVEETEDHSIITLYVSGRRPGEFSTILSTVYNDHPSSLHKRQAQQTAAIYNADDLYEFGASKRNQMIVNMDSFEFKQIALEKESKIHECQGSSCLNLNTNTASLESIVGDVNLWYSAKSKKQLKTLTIRSQVTSEPNSNALYNIS